ncbi:MAG: putative Flavoredoxin domain [Pseudomonadota bacterium]|jgi:flavin reductase (DIM6/NTAB) family NADH-FMN oxidoreductase RutF
MTIDQSALDRFIVGIRPPVIAVTTHCDGRDNGMIILSGAAGSVIPDAMRLSINICKSNFTHDLVTQSGVFAMHMLASGDEAALARSVEIVQTLGGLTGRDGDKMAGLNIKRGITGAPILTDALSVVECRVIKAFDCDEMTFFLGDVAGNEKLAKGMPLSAVQLWGALPPEWTHDYERRHTDGLQAEARKARGLA